MLVLKSICRMENDMEEKIREFMEKHAYLIFVATLIGMPIFMLTAVFACTAVITFPIAWILGWL